MPEQAPSAIREFHVVLWALQWGVVFYGAGFPISLHARRDDAIRAARDLASTVGANVVVHGLDGREQTSWVARN